MASLQQDVELDCSSKVLAEDKAVLSNYPAKLHGKAEGVESPAAEMPWTERKAGSNGGPEKQNKKRTK